MLRSGLEDGSETGGPRGGPAGSKDWRHRGSLQRPKEVQPPACGVRGEGRDSRETWLERPLRQGSREKEPESVQQKWESLKVIKEGSDIVRVGFRKIT